MKVKIIATVFISLIMLTSSFARANLILDTGSNINGPNYSFSPTQYFAGLFTTAQDWNINSLEAFVSNQFSSTDGNVEYALWTGDTISPLAKIFSGTSAISAGATGAWHGLFGLSEFLSAGTYWISATPSAGVWGAHYGNAPNGLQNYDQGGTSGWIRASAASYDTLNVGFRISATSSGASAVPEPSTLAILGLGLMGLAVRRFKKHA